MIIFSYQTDFQLINENAYREWLLNLTISYESTVKEVGYVFCTDKFLHEINLEHLNHDTYTDIITFDYGNQDMLEGEIYISIDRVEENAITYDTSFDVELRRVMSHGLLHMIGFKDDTEFNKAEMRVLEDQALQMFHVKQ